MRLTTDQLLHGYTIGIFPMAEHRDDPEIFWVEPRRRGILPLDGFRISRSLAKRMRNWPHRVTVNRDFAGVLDGCADRSDTWINDEIRHHYLALHRMGQAHSLEVWDGDELAGGVYGVAMGAVFFGESMFSRRTDASKIALAYLVDCLREGHFHLLDTQFLTEHLASLGGIEIPREEYLKLLRRALILPATFPSAGFPPPQDVIQRNTQTSYRL